MERRLDVEGRIDARRRGAEGALELDPGAFEQAGVGVFDEPLEGLVGGFVPEGEGGLEVVEDLFADVLGDVGGEHSDPRAPVLFCNR